VVQTAVTVGGTPSPDDYIGYVGNDLLRGDHYDFKLYAVPAASTAGSYQYYERVSAPPWSASAVSSSQMVNLAPQGLDQKTIRFDRPAGAQQQWLELHVTQAANMSVLYSRITVPDAKGASVTSWGYGGRSMLDFYHDQWMGSGMSAEGRKAWFDAMIQGGTGKVNVVIAEGFNDRNETETSLGGTTPGASPLAFSDNIKGMIAQVRKEWVASGHNVDDLSFTLLGMYDDDAEDQAGKLGIDQPLHQFAIELSKIAKLDSQISFVNLQNHVPDYAGLWANGWMYDQTHPTREGALAMSQIIVDTLAAPTVPEPNLGFLVLGGLVVLRRRR